MSVDPVVFGNDASVLWRIIHINILERKERRVERALNLMLQTSLPF